MKAGSNLKCSVCGLELKTTIMNNGIHYARLDCNKCGFKGWLKNPNNPKNTGTKLLRSSNKLSVEKIQQFHKFKEPFCFFCLRKMSELGIKETLTADHILELNQTEEGEDRDRVENGQILCSACHKWKLWATTYLNYHIRGKYDQ